MNHPHYTRLPRITAIVVLAALVAALDLPARALAAPAIVYVDDNWNGLPAGSDPDGAGPATSMGTDAFSTLTAGMNAVADSGTVVIAAGSYTENNYQLAKSLTLLGPNAAISPVSGTRLPEASITKMRLLIQNRASLTVSIQGLTFTGSFPTGGTGIIEITGSTSGTVVSVLRNRFVNVDRAAMHVSLQAANRPGNTGWRIEDNLVDGIPPVVGSDRSGFNLYRLSNLTVRGNAIRATGSHGINLDGVQGGLIESNLVADTPRAAIAVSGDSANISINANSLLNANNHATFGSATSGAIRLRPADFSGPVTITSNIIADSQNGLAFDPGYAGFSHTHVVLAYNRFDAQRNGVAILHPGSSDPQKPAGTLPALCNWYHDPAGAVAGAAADGNRQAISTSAGGVVLAAPWLVYGTDASPDSYTLAPLAAIPDTLGWQPPASVPLAAPGEVSAALNDYQLLANAVACARTGQQLVLSGAFDWDAPLARASWATGTTAEATDDYTILAPAGIHDVTLAATTPGGATISGSQPGSSAGSFITFAGDNQGWSIRNLRLAGFDTGVQLRPGASGSVQADYNDYAGIATGGTAVADLADGATVSAVCSWWGTYQGPTSPANPGGHGTQVGAGIPVTPWSRSASLSCVPGVDALNEPPLTLELDDAQASIAPGGSVTYTLTVRNRGPFTISGLVPRVTIPAHTSIATILDGGSRIAGGASWPAVSLAPGASTQHRVTLLVATPLPVGVTGFAGSARVDDDTGSYALASRNTPAGGGPDLRLLVSDGRAQAEPGSVLTYTLSYSNAGGRGASGVQVQVTVPAHASYQAAGSTPGWSCADGAAAGATCTLTVSHALQGGATGTLVFLARTDSAAPAGVIELRATVSDDGANGPEAAPGDNQAVDATSLQLTAPGEDERHLIYMPMLRKAP